MSNEKISSDTYGLPRDAQETQRLNKQNRFLLQIFGNCHIHPTIDTKKPHLKIADISCGSGIWLTEVAELYPQAECHGFDISAAQFPSSQHLSLQGLHERVQFHTRDAASSRSRGRIPRGLQHCECSHHAYQPPWRTVGPRSPRYCGDSSIRRISPMARLELLDRPSSPLQTWYQTLRDSRTSGRVS